jgi:hypothetical protein
VDGRISPTTSIVATVYIWLNFALYAKLSCLLDGNLRIISSFAWTAEVTYRVSRDTSVHLLMIQIHCEVSHFCAARKLVVFCCMSRPMSLPANNVTVVMETLHVDVTSE